jgi:hypothetical protein
MITAVPSQVKTRTDHPRHAPTPSAMPVARTFFLKSKFPPSPKLPLAPALSTENNTCKVSRQRKQCPSLPSRGKQQEHCTCTVKSVLPARHQCGATARNYRPVTSNVTSATHASKTPKAPFLLHCFTPTPPLHYHVLPACNQQKFRALTLRPGKHVALCWVYMYLPLSLGIRGADC